MTFFLFSSGNKLSTVLPLLHPECHSLPEPNLLPGQLSHGAVGMHGGKVRWLSMAFESVSRFHLSASHLHFALSCCHNPFAYSSLQDHIQGEIIFSDLFRLPSVGELYPGAARLPPAVFRLATGFPDLRALEADLYGNHRQVRGSAACESEAHFFCQLQRDSLMGACEMMYGSLVCF